MATLKDRVSTKHEEVGAVPNKFLFGHFVAHGYVREQFIPLLPPPITQTLAQRPLHRVNHPLGKAIRLWMFPGGQAVGYLMLGLKCLKFPHEFFALICQNLLRCPISAERTVEKPPR